MKSFIFFEFSFAEADFLAGITNISDFTILMGGVGNYIKVAPPSNNPLPLPGETGEDFVVRIMNEILTNFAGLAGICTSAPTEIGVTQSQTTTMGGIITVVGSACINNLVAAITYPVAKIASANISSQDVFFVAAQPQGLQIVGNGNFNLTNWAQTCQVRIV